MSFPVTDAHQHDEVLHKAVPDAPVFLARGGNGAVDIDDVQIYQLAQELVGELDRGRATSAVETKTLAEARRHLAQLMDTGALG